MGSARDINAMISGQKNEPGLTRLAYGSGAQAAGPAPIADLEQPLRSAQSIDLSREVRRDYEKARAREIEQWVQAHLAVQVRSCPVQ